MSDKTTSSSAEWAPCPFCGSVPYPEGEGFEHHQTDNCVLDSLWMRADELTKWNTRVQRTASQPADPVTNADSCQPVKVKPLVWTYVGGETWIARTTIGIASVQKDTHGWGVWLAGQNSESVCWRVENTIETAKAAAQADYEGRILAALDAAPRVNETPKSEHDRADVLDTQPAAVAPAEDAITKGETACQMLDRLGMDGAKWAAEFRTTALRLGYSDMDEGWLIGWFCNAIMAGHDRAQSPDAANRARGDA